MSNITPAGLRIYNGEKLTLEQAMHVLSGYASFADSMRQEDLVVVYPLNIFDPNNTDAWDTYMIVAPNNTFLAQINTHDEGAKVAGFHKAITGDGTLTSDEAYETILSTARPSIAQAVTDLYTAVTLQDKPLEKIINTKTVMQTSIPEIVEALRNPSLDGLKVNLGYNPLATY